MIWVGYICIAVAAGWFLYKAYVSYGSAGGTEFELPVYDAALYPPILVAVGLYFVLPSYGIEWPVWIFAAVWAVASVLAAGVIKLLEELGDRPL